MKYCQESCKQRIICPFPGKTVSPLLCKYAQSSSKWEPDCICGVGNSTFKPVFDLSCNRAQGLDQSETVNTISDLYRQIDQHTVNTAQRFKPKTTLFHPQSKPNQFAPTERKEVIFHWFQIPQLFSSPTSTSIAREQLKLCHHTR